MVKAGRKQGMIMTARLLALAAGVTIPGLALSVMLSLDTPDMRTAAELQAGPLVLQIGGQAGFMRLDADDTCLTRRCPVLELRFSPSCSGAAQSAPSEPGRVQRLDARTLERDGFSVQGADNQFGKQGRMRETSRAQPAEHEQRARRLIRN